MFSIFSKKREFNLSKDSSYLSRLQAETTSLTDAAREEVGKIKELALKELFSDMKLMNVLNEKQTQLSDIIGALKLMRHHWSFYGITDLETRNALGRLIARHTNERTATTVFLKELTSKFEAIRKTLSQAEQLLEKKQLTPAGAQQLKQDLIENKIIADPHAVKTSLFPSAQHSSQIATAQGPSPLPVWKQVLGSIFSGWTIENELNIDKDTSYLNGLNKIAASLTPEAKGKVTEILSLSEKALAKQNLVITEVQGKIARLLALETELNVISTHRQDRITQKLYKDPATTNDIQLMITECQKEVKSLQAQLSNTKATVTKMTAIRDLANKLLNQSPVTAPAAAAPSPAPVQPAGASAASSAAPSSPSSSSSSAAAAAAAPATPSIGEVVTFTREEFDNLEDEIEELMDELQTVKRDNVKLAAKIAATASSSSAVPAAAAGGGSASHLAGASTHTEEQLYQQIKQLTEELSSLKTIITSQQALIAKSNLGARNLAQGLSTNQQQQGLRQGPPAVTPAQQQIMSRGFSLPTGPRNQGGPQLSGVIADDQTAAMQPHTTARGIGASSSGQLNFSATARFGGSFSRSSGLHRTLQHIHAPSLVPSIAAITAKPETTVSVAATGFTGSASGRANGSSAQAGAAGALIPESDEEESHPNLPENEEGDVIIYSDDDSPPPPPPPLQFAKDATATAQPHADPAASSSAAVAASASTGQTLGAAGALPESRSSSRLKLDDSSEAKPLTGAHGAVGTAATAAIPSLWTAATATLPNDRKGDPLAFRKEALARDQARQSEE